MCRISDGPNQAKRWSAAPQAGLRLWQAAWRDAGIADCFVLASTFRSGSTRLAELLFHNGLPDMQEERFQEAWTCQEGPPGPPLSRYLDTVFGAAREGVFATKLMWPHLMFLARSLRLGRKDAAGVAGLFGPARWIHLRREDKIAQAISFWRAKATGRWHVFEAGEEPALAYDFAGIRDSLHEIEMHDRLWEDFFTRAGIVPVRVVYERFDAEPAGHLARILQACDHPVPAELNLANTLVRQRDSLSAAYRERFLDEIWQAPEA